MHRLCCNTAIDHYELRHFAHFMCLCNMFSDSTTKLFARYRSLEEEAMHCWVGGGGGGGGGRELILLCDFKGAQYSNRV